MVSPVKIRLAKSFVGPEEAEALTQVIGHAYLAMGVDVQAFEGELAGFLGGGREVLCVNTGTAALHLALQACGIGPGDEVLVPTLTYVATFQAISAAGATPVACDVHEETAWLDESDAEGRITDRTKAVLPVHFAGGCGDLDNLYALARKHNLRVIEDAAQAFGSSYKGTLIGARGDMVCFSFDGIKNITSGEGGAVVTADPEVAARVKDARLLGVQKDTEKRYSGQRSWDFDVSEQGWRYHMSNLFAAIGRVQLRRFPHEFQPKRIYLAQRYRELLKEVPNIRMLNFDYGAVVPFSFHVFVGQGKRDAVRDALAAAGIETGIHYKPNHFLTKYGGGWPKLPVAERMYEEVLALPFHPQLTEADQDMIVAILERVLTD